jgi:hypothetical protein
VILGKKILVLVFNFQLFRSLNKTIIIHLMGTALYIIEECYLNMEDSSLDKQSMQMQVGVLTKFLITAIYF